MHRIPRFVSFLAVFAAALAPSGTLAATITGDVSFQGNVVFESPIAGIAPEDLVVRNAISAEATGNGEHCDVNTIGSAAVSAGATWPASGTLTVNLSIGRGGNGNDPEGSCLLQLRASGNDGADVSAQGTVLVEITAAEIGANATVPTDDILVRQSKTQAGVDSLCLKWVKKQLKLRAKCNASLWTLGPAGVDKCKTAGVEPLGCDPANYVEKMLALGFGDTDQQDDPLTALTLDRVALSDQVACQRYLGKAVAGFVAKRMKSVQTSCVVPLADNEDCRLTVSADSNPKLGVIDGCTTTQQTDPDSLLTAPSVGSPCEAQCIDAGTLDRKCLKSCFELELASLSDGILGDVPDCGNGVIQAGEACDDGNVDDGDCCSAICLVEPMCP